MSKICAGERWITEGTWTNYAEEAFAMADLIIHMAFPPLICDYHILMRFISREKEENDNLFGVLKLMRQVHQYYSEEGIVSFRYHQSLISTYGKKSVLLQDKREVEDLVNSLKND